MEREVQTEEQRVDDRECPKEEVPAEKRKCFNCGKTGHRASQCPEGKGQQRGRGGRQGGPRKPGGVNVVSESGGDLVHAMVVDEDGFQRVGGEIDLTLFRARHAGGTQKERRKKGAEIRNVFEVLAEASRESSEQVHNCPPPPVPNTTAGCEQRKGKTPRGHSWG